MPTDQEPLFAGVKAQATGLKSDIAALARLRWQLARLEAAAAAQSIRRLALVVAVAALAALVALSVLVVALADVLDGRLGVPRWGWLSFFGFGLLATAALSAWMRWRRFRREFVGFEQTMEELREDITWLGERFR
ncbi:MAG TPA: phage holin family protein [Pirellulales bacterium]|nr:phage holin family protein [Pirellulales bacterium]